MAKRRMPTCPPWLTDLIDEVNGSDEWKSERWRLGKEAAVMFDDQADCIYDLIGCLIDKIENNRQRIETAGDGSEGTQDA